MIKKFLLKNSKTVTYSAILIAVSQLLSRFLGLLRDGLFARAFATTDQAGIYFAAFKIPDFVYNFLVAGGLSVVFIPLFAQYWHQHGKEKAWEMANNTINAIAFFITIVSFIFFIFSPQLLKIFVPGFSDSQLQTAIPLMRLLLISPIFMGISSLLSSALMHFDNFSSYSLAPIIYNLSIIFGIIFLAPIFGVFGVGIGVVIGSFLHFAIQLPGAIYNGYVFKPILDFKNQALKNMYRLALPRIIATSSQQIDDLLTTGIVSVVVSVSAISVLAYAYNLQYVVIGLFSFPIAISIFPKLSRFWEENNLEKFFSSFKNALSQIMFWTTPLAILLYVFRAHVVRLIYETMGNIGKHGNFSKEAVILTSACLGIYAITILFTSLLPIFNRGFFASKNTKIPTVIAVVCILLDIFLSLALPVLIKTNGKFAIFVSNFFDLEMAKDFSIVGVPLALLISSFLQFILIFYFFSKRIGDFGIKDFLDSTLKILFASVFAGLASYFSLQFFAMANNSNFAFNNPAVLLFIKTMFAGVIGLCVYLFFCYIFHVRELKEYLVKLKLKITV